MHFSGEPAQIAEIKRLASGAVTPFYRRAINEGIQLFLAGSAGLLQTTEDVRFEPCPGLTAAGRGVVSPENIAFTRWLTHLQNGVLLDEQNCLMLHELWLQSGTGQRRWEGLPDDVRDTITVLFTAKRGDWCGFWSDQIKVLWADSDGLCLFTKRLERGRFVWPVTRDGKVHLTPAQLSMLLEGINWKHPKRTERAGIRI
ncbi:IS66 family insertion sequence element accessory protein TnpB [Escherichia coli]|nr:IS66 family insertion sequence element accessory protein TnpB [Escherichia coli]